MKEWMSDIFFSNLKIMKVLSSLLTISNRQTVVIKIEEKSIKCCEPGHLEAIGGHVEEKLSLTCVLVLVGSVVVSKV